VAQKFCNWHALLVHLIISSNIDQFSHFFQCQNQEKMCRPNSAITKHPTAPQVCRYTLPCEVSVSSKQQLKTRLL